MNTYTSKEVLLVMHNLVLVTVPCIDAFITKASILLPCVILVHFLYFKRIIVTVNVNIQLELHLKYEHC